MHTIKSQNINNIYFDGYYKEIWRKLIPEALTKAEVEFFVEEGKLEPRNKVLDLMCGYGRHTLELARRGIDVTAVDNLHEYINEIRQTVRKENLTVSCIELDVTEYKPNELFDQSICIGNNLSFFDKKELQKLFSMISSHTKPGGTFIANSWMIAEIVFKNFSTNSWSSIDSYKYLVSSKYWFRPTRIETETIIIPETGPNEIKRAVDYIYSLNELESMLNKSGFLVKEVWSIPGKKKFTIGEPRAYIVAEKT